MATTPAFFLKKPMDTGAGRDVVRGVAKTDTYAHESIVTNQGVRCGVEENARA